MVGAPLPTSGMELCVGKYREQGMERGGQKGRQGLNHSGP